MRDERELDDACGTGGVNVYQKSLLYLVARDLERPTRGAGGEVPLLGMERFFDRSLVGDATTVREAIAPVGGDAIFAHQATPADAETHGGFDDDPATMTSVVMRPLGVVTPDLVQEYRADATLHHAGRAPAPDHPIAAAFATGPATPPRTTATALPTPTETEEPGSIPLVAVAEGQTDRPVAPPQPDRLVVEVAVAPRSGSAIGDVLQASGWQLATPTTVGANGGCPVEADR